MGRGVLLKSHSIHDFEIAFCGYSNSGKSTLISELLKKLTPQYEIGYYKHDAHRFEMDKEGKDTFVARASGASSLLINSDEQSAMLNWAEHRDFSPYQSFIDNDFVFIEGFKNSGLPKFLVLGEGEQKEKLLNDYHAGRFENIIGIVGREEQGNFGETPYFMASDISNIAQFIVERIKSLIVKRPLYGLILTGGKSSRMGEDKGQINYHGVSQVEHCYDLLSRVTDQCFVSCREDQLDLPHLKNCQKITDKFLGMGPMGGILTAMQEHPNARILVLAVDLPFVSFESLKTLVDGADGMKVASAFLNPIKNWAEPLFTIYEPKAYSKFLQVLSMRKSCPRKVLLNSNILLIKPEDASILDNANTKEDYLYAQSIIHHKSEVHVES
jgi:molybdenum cofactor guanylyltransferase